MSRTFRDGGRNDFPVPGDRNRLSAPTILTKNAQFVSYAGNFEDLILNRVFPQATGFFVDVGAHDPKVRVKHLGAI